MTEFLPTPKTSATPTATTGTAATRRRPLQLNSHVQQHLHATSSIIITNATTTFFTKLITSATTSPNERNDALYGMTSPNYDEDFNIELCPSTPSEKVVETKRKHFSCRSIFILVVARRGH